LNCGRSQLNSLCKCRTQWNLHIFQADKQCSWHFQMILCKFLWHMVCILCPVWSCIVLIGRSLLGILYMSDNYLNQLQN
jgi:hypothetical protein